MVNTIRIAVLLTAMLAVVACKRIDSDDAPEFSFWGNLPDAMELVEGPDPPAPLPAELAARCRVQTGEGLTLIRAGVLVGKGRVGEAYGGSIPQAGDDRLVFFQPVGLPDSVDVRVNRGWPDRYDPNDRKRTPALGNPHYDLYVVGPREVHLAAGDTIALPPHIDLHETVAWLLREGTISPLDLATSIPDDRGHIVVPDTTTAVAWIAAETELNVLRISTPSDSPVLVLSCSASSHQFGPYFAVFYSEDQKERYAVRGELDLMLEIDDVLYAVVRTGIAATGAWAYIVYRIGRSGEVSSYYSDGSWST